MMAYCKDSAKKNQQKEFQKLNFENLLSQMGTLFILLTLMMSRARLVPPEATAATKQQLVQPNKTHVSIKLETLDFRGLKFSSSSSIFTIN